jgi:drug efflux transport system permease protein
MQRVRYLVWKELLELKDDPRLFVIVILAPILQLLMLGYAATTDVREVPILMVDADRSTASRDLIARFSASPYFSVVGLAGSADSVDGYFETGRAWMALNIPAGFGESIGRGRPQTIQVLADGSDANSTGLGMSYAASLLAGYAQELTAARLPPGAPRLTGAGIDARVRVWFNPRLESRHFMLPGVLALLLLAVTTILAAMGIVRERERGTLEQLNVTPLRRWEIILGKLLPYAIVGMIDVCLVIGVTVFWFEVPLRGSVLLLFAMAAVYLLSTLGLGLFISTISASEQQAEMTAAFFFLIPMVFLSGFVFPIENMPEIIQRLTYLVPLRYFLIILRSIFLKGVGLETFWPEALALLAWGLTMLTLAVLRSTKRTA